MVQRVETFFKRKADPIPVQKRLIDLSKAVNSLPASMPVDPTLASGNDLGAMIMNTIATSKDSKGVNICIPEGDFDVSTPIDLAASGKSIILSGMGMGITRLNWKGTKATYVIRASAINLSGFMSVRDLSIIGQGVAQPGQVGIYCNGAQDITTILGCEITQIGADAIFVDAASALINVHACYIHKNLFGYALSIVNNAVQNFVLDNCEIFNNDGGVNITGSAGIMIRDNDIESGSQGTASQPMLNMQDVNVESTGNTYGLGPNSTASGVILVGKNSFRSQGDTIALGTNAQIGIDIGSGASQAMILAPVLAAPGGGGGTGINIQSGARNTYILNGSFYNSFTNNVVDAGTNTTNLNPLSL